MNPLLEVDTTKTVYWGCRSGKPWHLAGVGAGVEAVAIGDSPTGHMFAPVSILTSEGARQDGATFLRSLRNKKEVDAVVSIGGHALPKILMTPRQFYAVHDAFWRDWSTDVPGTLGFYTRHNGWRFQQVRLDAAPEPTTGVDPATTLHESYTVSFVAMDPLEQHLGEYFVWLNEDGRNEGIVKARNAADQEAWPRYTMPGPGRYWIQDPTDPDGLRLVQTPPIDDGETLRIDSHPRHRTARVYSDANPDGRNVWGALAGRRWLASLPPWSSTDIVVRVEGGNLDSSVRVDVTPRSSRPF
ncbi:putative phage tail protein [Nocardia nova SH22a]|uniref:Putative phage tail protein n=1 Tax=Nocardia nova SH22a TaxID=1415166 RepID=W5TH72_9NOCA|nr:hypothetical protein [Nocardia nova]AHH16591.1 putative phage tail protein [Nocardia nova SH22a]